MNIYISIVLWRWSERPLKLAAVAVPNTVKILKGHEPKAYHKCWWMQLVYHYKTELHRCFLKLNSVFSDHWILCIGIHANRVPRWCSELSGFRCCRGTGQLLPRKAHGFMSQFKRASLFRKAIQSIAPELTCSCTFLNHDFRDCLHKRERKSKKQGWVSLLRARLGFYAHSAGFRGSHSLAMYAWPLPLTKLMPWQNWWRGSSQYPRKLKSLCRDTLALLSPVLL